MAGKRRLSPNDVGWLQSLFYDPIAWRPHLGEFDNGRHRTCAMRSAGVSQIAVDTAD